MVLVFIALLCQLLLYLNPENILWPTSTDFHDFWIGWIKSGFRQDHFFDRAIAINMVVSYSFTLVIATMKEAPLFVFGWDIPFLQPLLGKFSYTLDTS